MKRKIKDRREKIIEWVVGGPYAVAVEVEVLYPGDDPSEPCFTPENVRYLEKLQALAEAGDVEALKKVGTVYVRMDDGSNQGVAMTTEAATKVSAAG